MCTNRRGIPAEFKDGKVKNKMKVGVINHTHITDCTIIKWMDKRTVTVLTTLHEADVVPRTRRTKHSSTGQEVVDKPVAIVDYNKLTTVTSSSATTRFTKVVEEAPPKLSMCKCLQCLHRNSLTQSADSRASPC